jgi:hypothetical protein
MVNYRKEPQEIFVQMDVEYMPGKVGNDAMQFTLAATGKLVLSSCFLAGPPLTGGIECSSRTQSFKPPKNTAGEIKSAPYPITMDGHFIAARGHMHGGSIQSDTPLQLRPTLKLRPYSPLSPLTNTLTDGGTYVSMRINNNVVCTSNATYGGAGSSTIINGKEWQTITKMSECAGPIPVKKGDQVLISAGYDTEKHPL